jgi:rhodanese-related sulfurtransferase
MRPADQRSKRRSPHTLTARCSDGPSKHAWSSGQGSAPRSPGVAPAHGKQRLVEARREPDRSGQTRSQYGSAVAQAEPSPTSNGNTDRREVLRAASLRCPKPSNGGSGRLSLEGLISEAVARITRFSAPEALSASVADGLVIDIRSQDARMLRGVVPGSLHMPRTVLEWRIALDSPWRNVHLGGLDQRLTLICDHGYSSILAASNLVQLGFYRAGDVIGGFEAWKDMGLPLEPCRPRLGSVDMLPGMGPPK